MDIAEAFEILGLPGDATAREIRDAYLRLSRQVHADVGGSDALFRKVQGAYEMLHDRTSSERRATSADGDECARASRIRSPLEAWLRSHPSMAVFLSGAIVLLVGVRSGAGTAPFALVGSVALVIGITGLLGASRVPLEPPGDGLALLRSQVRAGLPRVFKALGVHVAVVITVLAAVSIAVERSSRRRLHR
jgi:hypothetical protein